MILKQFIARNPLAFGAAILTVAAVMWVWIIMVCLCRIAGRHNAS